MVRELIQMLVTPKRLGFDYYISTKKERRTEKDKKRQLYLIENSKKRRKSLRKYFKKIKNTEKIVKFNATIRSIFVWGSIFMFVSFVCKFFFHYFGDRI